MMENEDLKKEIEYLMKEKEIIFNLEKSISDDVKIRCLYILKKAKEFVNRRVENKENVHKFNNKLKNLEELKKLYATEIISLKKWDLIANWDIEDNHQDLINSISINTKLIDSLINNLKEDLKHIKQDIRKVKAVTGYQMGKKLQKILKKENQTITKDDIEHLLIENDIIEKQSSSIFKREPKLSREINTNI